MAPEQYIETESGVWCATCNTRLEKDTYTHVVKACPVCHGKGAA